MQIRGSIKGYGFVHICIDDCHDTTMTIGPGWTLAEFVKKHKAKALEFRAWRIVDDCLSKKLEVSNDVVNTILKNASIISIWFSFFIFFICYSISFV